MLTLVHGLDLILESINHVSGLGGMQDYQDYH